MLNNIVSILDTGAAGGVGDYESIATVTVGGSGLTTATFSSIPSTYKHLQVRITNLTNSATNDVRMRFNSDTGSNYVWHQLQGNGASASAATNTSQTYIAAGLTGSSTNPATTIVDILDYTNTNKYTTARILGGYDANGSGYVFLWSGLWQNTNAISTIEFSCSAVDFNQYSHFALYGVKG